MADLEVTQAFQIDPGKPPPIYVGPDRRCVMSSCLAILSKYNLEHAPFCWICHSKLLSQEHVRAEYLVRTGLTVPKAYRRAENEFKAYRRSLAEQSPTQMPDRLVVSV